jgi:hypothetical protein
MWEYNIFMCCDKNTVLGMAKDIDKEGWETISVFKDEDGLLCLMARRKKK